MASKVVTMGFLIACISLMTLVNKTTAYADCPDCGICQERYLPVCAEDGVTYHNACHLGCEKQCRKPGLKIVHDGECGNQLVYKYH